MTRNPLLFQVNHSFFDFGLETRFLYQYTLSSTHSTPQKWRIANS